MTHDLPDETLGETELIPVEPAEVTPAAEFLEELLPPLDPEEAARLWRRVHRDYADALADRLEWSDKLDVWEKQYLGVLPEKTFPWPGCSNFHVPLTMVGVETLKPRLAVSVLAGDPMVLAKLVSGTSEERRDRAEMFLNWQLVSELRIEPLVLASAHQFLIPGVVVAKVLWRTDRRKIKALRRFPLSVTMDVLFRDLFGPTAPVDLKQNGERWSGTIKQLDGTALDVKLRVRPTDTELLVLIEKEDVVYDGPRVELIAAQDFIVPVNGGGDVQQLPWCQHRLWLTEDALRAKVKRGKFSQEAVEQLINVVQGLGESSETTADTQALKETQAIAEGTTLDAATDVKADQYEILEDYRRWDIDGDGFDEEIITWISPMLPDQLLGWDYLDNVVAHGRRPWVVGRYLPLGDRFYGLSFAEIVRGIQEEINAIHNQRGDSGTIRNTPGYFYRAGMTHSPQSYRLQPGQGVPVDNPTGDIFIPQWNGSDSSGQAEEALLYQYFERLTGLPDLVLGRQPNRVGATRTASGTSALLSEAGLRFEAAMRSFQAFWLEIFQHVLDLDAQYLPPGKEFRVTGRSPELLRINDRSELMGHYDLVLSTTTGNLNKQVLREDATIKLNTALNPLVLQFGLVSLKGLRRLLRQFYRAYGEPDPDLILEPAREMLVHSPQEELEMWVDGQDVEPSPQENLEAHFTEHQRQMSDATVQAVLGPAGIEKIRKHIGRTTELIQMQAMAQQLQMGAGGRGQGASAQAAIAGPQAMNAQIGRTAPQQPTTRMMNAGAPNA